MSLKDPRESKAVVLAVDFVAGATRASDLPPPTIAEVAFAGRSNVGKSSLLNALMQRRGLARTSGTPGCTRQINVFRVSARLPSLPEPLELHFVDLPGYGYAKRSRTELATWGPMLEGYLRTRVPLRAVVVLVDVRRGVEDDDRELVEFLRAPRASKDLRPLDVVLVATKVDKLSRSAQKPALERLRGAQGKVTGVPILGVSAETGQGLAELWDRIRSSVLLPA
jgi:GTP-binding protein